MRVICSRKTMAKLAFLTVKIIDDFEKIQKKSETKQERFQEIGLFFFIDMPSFTFRFKQVSIVPDWEKEILKTHKVIM
jgi:hypothetical protein